MSDGTDVGGIFVTVKPDLSGFREELQAGLEEDTRGTDEHVPIHIDADDDNFAATYEKDTNLARAFGAQRIVPKADLDDIELQAKLDANLEKATALADRAFTIKVDADDSEAKAKLEALQDEAKRLEEEVYTPHVSLAGAEATAAKIDDLDARLDAFGKKRETAKVDVDTGDSGKKLDDLKNAADNAAGAGTEGGLSGLAQAAIALGPALIPIGAASTATLGGLLSLATGAGAGIVGVGAVSTEVLGKVFAATTNLQAAQQKYNAAVADGSKSGQKAALQEETAAYVGLDAGQRKAAESLASLKNEFQTFSQSFQPQVFELFDQALKVASGLMKDFGPVIRGSFTALESLGDEMSKLIDGPAGRKFISFLTTEAPLGIKVFGQALINIGQGFAGIVEAFAPFSRILGAGIDDLTGRFAKFGEGLASSSGFRSFIDYAEKEGPVVGEVLGQLGKTFEQLLVALQPLGSAVLSALDPLLKDVGTLAGPIGLLGAAIGDLLGPVTRVVTGIVDALVPGLDLLLKALGPVVASLGGQLATVLAGTLRAITPVVTALGGALGGALTQLGRTLTPLITLMGTALVSTLQSLTPLIAPLVNDFGVLLVAALRDLTPLFTALSSTLLPVIPPLLKAMDTAIVPLVASMGQLVPALGAAGAQLSGAFAKALPSLTPALVALVNSGVVPLAKAIVPLIPLVANVAVLLLRLLPAAIEVSTPFLQLSAAILPVVARLISLVGVLGQIISPLSGATEHVGQLSGVVATLAAVVGSALPAVINIFSALPGRVIGAVSDLVPAITSFGSAVMRGLLGGISGGVGSVISLVGSLPGWVVGALGDVSGLLFDAGAQIINGLVGGIESRAGAAADAVGSAVSNAYHHALSFLGIASPSKLFQEVGVNIVKGLEVGITSETPQAVASITDTLQQMRTKALNEGLKVIDDLTKTSTTSKNGTTSLVSLPSSTQLDQAQVDAIADKLPEAIRSKIEKAGPQTVGELKTLFSKLNADVPISDIDAVAGRLPNAIVDELKKAGPLTVAQTKSLADGLVKTLNAAGADITKGLAGSTSQLATYVGDAKSSIDKAFKGTTFDGIVDGLASQFDYLSAKGAASLQAITSQLTAAQTALASIKSQIAQSASSIEGEYNVTSITGATSTNPSTGSTWTAPVTGANIISALKADLANLSKYHSLLDTLKAWGLSEDILAQLVAAGPTQGLATAVALIAGGKHEVSLADVLQGDINAQSTAIATVSAQAEIGGKEVGLSQAEGIVESLQKSKTQITAELNTIAADMKKAMSDALEISGGSSGTFRTLGSQIMDGLRSGITGANSGIQAELTSVAESMEAAIKKALGIRSPSQVFAEIGGNVMAGLAEGINGTAGLAGDAIDNVYGTLTAKSKQKALTFQAPTITGLGGSIHPVSVSSAPQIIIQGDASPSTVALIRTELDRYTSRLERELAW